MGRNTATACGRSSFVESLEARRLLTDVLSTQAAYNDIVYDSSANLHVAWYDPQTQKLMYRQKSGATGAWTTTNPIEVISSRTGIGSQLSIAVDANGTVGIAFRDDTNTDLLYASKAAGASTFTPAANLIHTSSCQYISLAFNQLNQAVVSYYLTTTDDLLVSTLQGSGNWSRAAVDTANDVGRWSSLAIIPGTNRLAVAYEDSTSGAIRYRAQDAAGAWPTTANTIASGLSGGGWYVSLGFNNATSPKPSVAYYDAAGQILRVANATDTVGTSWSTGYTQQRESRWENLIFSAADGKFHLIYQDTPNDDVAYLWGSGQSWESAVLSDQGGDRIAATMLDRSIAYTHFYQGQTTLSIDYRPGTLYNRPSGVTAVASSATSVTVSWSDDSTTAESGFHVYRTARPGEAWQYVGSTGANVATLTDSTVSPGSTYAYRVRAFRGGGTSAFSDASAEVTTPTPAAPAALTAALTAENFFNITWARADGNNGYVVQRKLTGEPEAAWVDVQALAKDVEGWLDNAVQPGTTYDYRVRAANNGAWSTIVENLTRPGSPPGFAASAVAFDEVALTWSDVQGESHYVAEASADAWGTIAWSAQPPQDATQVNATGLAGATGYSFRLRAVNTSGASGDATATAETPPQPAAIALTATIISDAQVDLAWGAITDATTYVLTRTLNGVGTPQTRYTGAALSFSDTGLEDGTAYAYALEARRADGVSLGGGGTDATTLPNDPWSYLPSDMMPPLQSGTDSVFDGSRVLRRGAPVNTHSNAVELLDVATGTLLHTFTPPADVYSFGAAMAFLGAEIVINGWVGTVSSDEQSFAFIYDANGVLQRQIAGPRGAGLSMSELIVSGDRIIMAGRNGAYAYDGQTGEQLQSFYVPGRETQTRMLGIAASDTRVLFRTELQRVHLFDLGSGTRLHSFQHPTHPDDNGPWDNHYFGSSMAVWGNDVLVNSEGSGEHNVFRYDGTTGALIHSYRNPTPYSPTAEGFGSYFLFSGNDLIIRGADLVDGTGDPYWQIPSWWEGPYWVDRGEAHVFDLRTNKLRQNITRPAGARAFFLTHATNGILLATSHTGDASNPTKNTHLFRRPGPDLRIDSNNDGVIDDADDAIEDDANLPGKVIALNDDDDDQDDVVDYLGGGIEQSEFAELMLSVPNMDLSGALFKIAYSASPPSSGGGGGHLRIWRGDTNEYVSADTPMSAASLGIANGSANFKIEAIRAAATAADGDISLWVDFDGFLSTMPFLLIDTVTTLPTKPGLELLPTGQGTTGELPHNNPDGTNGTPDFKGGFRFFPDATSIATFNTARNIIRLRAEIPGVAKADVPVYFRAFDVDDPSEVAAIDPNDDGWDNRGKVAAAGNSPINSVQPGDGGFRGRLRRVGGALAAEGAVVMAKTVLQDGRAFAEVELATSFAPGDNFRVVASVDRKNVEAANLNDTTGVPTNGEVKKLAGVASEQISVWRHLRIEQDKMKKTGANGAALGDTQSGITNNPIPAPVNNLIEITTDIDIQFANSYENGVLRDANDVNHHIVLNTSGANAKVTILAGAVPPAGGPVKIYQDDFRASASTRGHRFGGKITAVLVGPNAGQFTVTTDTTLELNEFQSGTLFDANRATYAIVSNTAGANAQVVVTAAAAPASGDMALFRQIGNDVPVTVVDTEDDSHLYDMLQETTVRAENRFADAYIQPDLHTLDDLDSITTVGQTKVAADNVHILNFANPPRGSTNKESHVFWVAHVITAFEALSPIGGPPGPLDNDPGGDPFNLGWATAEGVTDGPGGMSSLIFLESVRDGAVFRGDPTDVSRARNTIHEVAHQLNVANVPGEHRQAADNVMYGGGVAGVPDAQYYFHPDDVVFLRFEHRAPGSR